jgi:hypothetical protein
MTCIAASFGAPVTEPGGKVAASSSARLTVGVSRPRTVETSCQTPGCGSVRRGAALMDPYSHTRPRSLRTRSTIITCSAASLAEPSSSARAAAAAGASGSASERGRVPFIGSHHTSGPVWRRNRSGERLTTPPTAAAKRGAVSSKARASSVSGSP